MKIQPASNRRLGSRPPGWPWRQASIVVVGAAAFWGCQEPAKILPKADSVPSLSYEIVDREISLKGGSVSPVTPPRYKFLSAKAALKDAPEKFTKEAVEATLSAVLAELKEEPGIDGISAYLYLSREHANGSNLALGTAEWWPKGHSFGVENTANIHNKAGYEVSIRILSLPVPSKGGVVTRIPEDIRRGIFTEAVKCEDRAEEEAEKKYPTDEFPSTGDPSRDREKARSILSKHVDESRRLLAEYEGKLCDKYALTADELDLIKSEAFQEGWPIPSVR